MENNEKHEWQMPGISENDVRARTSQIHLPTWASD